MGTRANVFVQAVGEPQGQGVYLYQHWDGDDLPKTVQDAVRRGHGFWDDPEYFTRIIFCEMVKGDVEGTRGFGISSVLGDGEDRILTIDTEAQTISFSFVDGLGEIRHRNTSSLVWFSEATDHELKEAFTKSEGG